MIHESIHFLRRYKYQGKEKSLYSIKEEFIAKKKSIVNEGGEKMSFEIFGIDTIEDLNIFQVLYILNINNWKKGLKEFEDEFLTATDGKNKKIQDYLSKVDREKEDFKILTGLNDEEVITNESVLSRQIMTFETSNETKKIGLRDIKMELGHCMISLIRKEKPEYI